MGVSASTGSWGFAALRGGLAASLVVSASRGSWGFAALLGGLAASLVVSASEESLGFAALLGGLTASSDSPFGVENFWSSSPFEFSNSSTLSLSFLFSSMRTSKPLLSSAFSW